MSDVITFTADEKDVLRELMNIASGNATAVIADILGSFATLSIPDFDIYTPPQLKSYLHSKCDRYTLYAKQGFLGEVEGETLFFIQEQSLPSLSASFSIEGEDISQKDMLLELMNILNSTLISRFVTEMGTTVSFTMPGSNEIEVLEKSLDNLAEDYTQMIVVHTLVTFEKEHIHGEVAILTKDNSIKWILNAVQRMVEEAM